MGYVANSKKLSQRPDLVWKALSAVGTTRAAFVNFCAIYTPPVGTTVFVAGIAYRYIGSGTAIPDLPGWVPAMTVTIAHWITNAVPGETDIGDAFEQAMQYLYDIGGGDLLVPAGNWATSKQIWVKQRCGLIGEWAAYANQYSNGIFEPMGSVIWALDGMNDDIVVCRGDAAYDGSILRETGTGMQNNERRFMQRVRNLCIYGNRSQTADPDVRDTNTSGRGLVIQGSSYVNASNVYIMYCAGTGYWAGSYDYGNGSPLTSTNLTITEVHSLSNYGKGFEIYSGDHRYTNIQAGFNGDTGIYATGTGHYTAYASWNNKGHGMLFAGASFNGKAILEAGRIYDNDLIGLYIGAGNAPNVDGLTSTGNGRTAVEDNTYNVLVASTAENWFLDGVTSDGKDYTGAVTTTVGIKINSEHPGYLGDWSDENSPIAISPSLELGVTSITGGVLECGRYRQVVLNIDGGATITSITVDTPAKLPTVEIRNVNVADVTFTHNNDSIRTLTGATVTLQQNKGFFTARTITPTIMQQK